MSRKLRHHQYERLKSIAADLIEDYELTYPLEPWTIAKFLGVGITVHRLGLPVDASFCDTDDGYTEAIESAHGTKFHIHLNGTKPPMRQRFTVTHEIGHVWGDHLRAGVSISQETAEAEANFMAGYLLAPDALVNAWVPDLTIANIAAVFEMSDEAARFAQARVVRANTANAFLGHHDLRILATASRRLRNGYASAGRVWDSA